MVLHGLQLVSAEETSQDARRVEESLKQERLARDAVQTMVGRSGCRRWFSAQHVTRLPLMLSSWQTLKPTCVRPVTVLLNFAVVTTTWWLLCVPHMALCKRWVPVVLGVGHLLHITIVRV